jgi:hypothetical protein
MLFPAVSFGLLLTLHSNIAWAQDPGKLASNAVYTSADDHFRIAPGLTVHYGELVARGAILGRSGRVLLAFTDRAGAFEAARVAGTAGVATLTELRGGLWRVVPQSGVDDIELARRLDRLPGVDFAMPDLILPLSPFSLPNDPFLAAEWHLENVGDNGRVADSDIDATQAWTYGTGVGQIIAIIDTGVQLDHPDLNVVSGHDYIGRDDDSSPDYAEPSGGPHGTGTAGIAAAIGNNNYGVAGVAFDAQIYAVRLIGGSTSTEDVYDAFVESVDAGASVLSNSWGYQGCGEIPASNVFSRMFRYAENNGRGGLGSVVVFASGNDGCDVVANGMLAMETPIVVAAVESSDVRASYSNYGDSVDIAAPTALLTTDWTSGGYGSYAGDDAFADGFSGTSGATPVVAGVVALMFEANPRITAEQVREVLCETAVRIDLEHVDYDAEGRTPYYGCGRIDAGAAVTAVANTEPDAPQITSAGEQIEGSVWLTWDPAFDADADNLSYRVTVTVTGGTDTAGEADVTEYTNNQPFLKLDDAVADDVLSWTVAAVDPWGAGPESAPAMLTVLAMPVDEPELDSRSEPNMADPPLCGCAVGSSVEGGWSALLGAVAVLGALARRRSLG